MDLVPSDFSLGEFSEVVSGLDEEIDLARAVLVAAKIEYPDLEVNPLLDSLDALAAQIVRRVGPAADPLLQVETLLAVVIREQGLQGAEEDYYNPRNSFLNDVLERKVGIPIALSILLMSVGARAGIALGGTSMPMHFLVRVLGVDPPIFIDSYGGGRLLSVEDCQAALERMAGRAFPFRPEMLDVVSNRDILTRFLTNLKLIYLNSGVFQKGIAMLERLLVLNPAMPLLLRERGLINLMLGQADQARRDLRHYVKLAQDAPDIQEIIDLLRRMG